MQCHCAWVSARHGGEHPHRPDLDCPDKPFWPPHAAPPGRRCMCSQCTPPDEASMARYYEAAHGPEWEGMTAEQAERLEATVRQGRTFEQAQRGLMTRRIEDARIAAALRRFVEAAPVVPYSDEAMEIWADLRDILKGEQ